MANYRIIGDLVVTAQEFRQQAAAIGVLAQAVKARTPAQPVAFLRGEVTSDSLKGQAALLDAPATGQPAAPKLEGDFDEVGLNLPLTVLIRHVYTGEHPKKAFLQKRKDMAVVSSIRDFASFNAASRAINILRSDVKANTNLTGPSAVEDGTNVVAYFPAVTQDSLILTIEMAFDQFPDELVSKAGDLFRSAASLPLFMPASGYLMIAGSVAKLAAGAGHALWDGRPSFSRTITLDFDLPGSDAPVADFRVLCNDSFDPQPFRFKPNIGLVDPQTSKPYDGPEPYVVISLDGRPRKLDTFAPTLISSALLQKFFDMKDGAEASIDVLTEAFGLLNDAHYRKEVDDLARDLAAPALPDAERQKLQDRRAALIRNIKSEVMKPV